MYGDLVRRRVTLIRQMHPYVDRYVNVLETPNHPARLLSLFASTVAFCALVGAAIGALLYVVNDARRGGAGGAAPAPLSDGGVQAPDGLEVVRIVDSAGEFEELTGFAPFVPERVPATTGPMPNFAVSQPDAEGHRAGRVAFSINTGRDVDGITGPIVVIVQSDHVSYGDDGGALRQLTQPDTRGIVSALSCGDLSLEVQLFFGPNAADGEPVITPYMQEVARDFVARVREQCGG
jgi:hypothetical protein